MHTAMNVVFMAIVLLFSLTVHESAHAWAAHRLGDDTAKMRGRISLNPLMHIDPFGTLLFPAILIIIRSPILFGWAKPVPVNVMNFKNPVRDHGIVAAAGPASNLVIAIGAFILLKTLLIISHGAQSLEQHFLYLLLAVNVVLAVFNMIPLFPLDGGAVLLALTPRRHRGTLEGFNRYGFIILIFILFTGVIDRIIGLILAIINVMLRI